MSGSVLEMAAAACTAQPHEMALLEKLCEAAQEQLSRQMRPGVAPADCQTAFECATALTAGAALLECRSAGGTWQSFRAGEVSVTGADGAELGKRAALLWRQARAILLPFEKDGGVLRGGAGMMHSFSAAARRFGRSVTVLRGGMEQVVWAFVQPLGSKGELRGPMTALGEVDERQWLYLGDGATALAEGESLRCDGRHFAVREAALVRLGAQTVCCRAVLRPGSGGGR